jgi:hypothetical protein
MTLASIAPAAAIAFNLGGFYNDKGQQCAAADIGNGIVYFVDIARGLDYFFECGLSVSEIRYEYLNNRGVHVQLDDYAAKNQLRRELEALAATAPAI